LLSRTAYPGNSVGITPVRPGSNGQSQLTETFFYEPIFNRLCARVERRRNPINSTGGYFPPQNLGTASAARYATITYYDYQRISRARSAAIRPCRRRWASAPRRSASYTFVTGQCERRGP